MKFKKIELHAFRAYENKENGTFDFTLENNKIANFISIYAPNGFGKTSFYDGVEWCLTDGTIRRFKNNNEDAEAERINILDDKKQFILQNKRIDISKNRGFVNIETDRHVYKKDIKQISTSSTADYVFNKRKIENRFFQDVILSQEGIDSFLNEDNDKDRFKKYSLNFGNNEDLDYHKKILLLEGKNRSDLKDIRKRKEEIENLLDSDLDESIFDDVNQILHQLKLIDVEFELVDDSFGEVKKLKLENKISEQTIDLNNKIDGYKSSIDKLPLSLKDSKKYFKEQTELKILQKKLNDYIELNDTHVKMTLLNNKLTEKEKEVTRLEELKKDSPIYENSIEILKDNEKNIKKYRDEKLLKEKELNEISIQINEISTNIKLKETTKKEINNSIESVSTIFENIRIIQKDIENYKQQIELTKKLLLSYESDIKILEDKQKKLKQIKNAVQNNIFIDVNTEDKYKTTIEKIESLLESKELNSKSLSLIKDKKVVYQQYNKNLKELMSLGMNIIQSNQDNTCPLCNQEYSSYDTLQESIINNPLLDNIEKDLLEEEKKINLLLNKNNREIKEAKQSIILNFDSELSEINNKLNELKYKLNQIDLVELNKKLNDKESLLLDMLNKVGQESKDEYLEQKNKELDQLTNDLSVLYDDRKKQESFLKDVTDKIEKLNSLLNHSSKIIDNTKLKKEYKSLNSWINTFENIEFNVFDKLNNDIKFIEDDIVSSKKERNNLEDEFDKLIMNHSLTDIENILQVIEELKDKEFELAVSMKIFKDFYSRDFKNEIGDSKSVEQDIIKKKDILLKDINKFKKKLELIQKVQQNTDNLLKFIENRNRTKELEKYKNDFLSKDKVQKHLKDEREKLELKINSDVESFFHEDLINQIYSKIDPHPEYKRVKFKCSFENSVGKLNIFVNDEKEDKHISPALYYSTAQLNVLSLSIFLAKALNVKDDKGKNVDCIFIDDPIQSMDSINILSTIDLLRSLVVNHKKQIILSTHDENFHYLLQKKIPTEYFDSKFIELETFGKVKRT